MWNEHCSYKSSRRHLKKLHTKGEQVIQGPGENAGVVDIEDDDAIVFKIESHNHPSFIEPYQGAATGVGGIMRDVFTMGARPIANLNSIHFGSPDHEKTRNLLRGVVKGIGGYGNCIGVPTIAGQTCFDESYNGNILVNAMTLGLVNKNKIFYSKAAGINKPVIYVGSKTGRDGIHGASMASAIFDDKIEEKKPTVQVGDPFTEKLLLEACLELMAGKSIISIQDMGAAGLTSSSIEMASKGDLGIEIDLTKVPCREENMTPYEIMLSESQERMLIVLEEGKENEAKKIFDKWNLDFAVIGKTTNSKNIELFNKKNNEFKVLVANPKKGGEGISLHKNCWNAIYVDRSYDCAKYLQSRDRIHRVLGPNDIAPENVNYYIFESWHPREFDLIDRRISSNLKRKLEVMIEVLNDKELIPLSLGEDDIGELENAGLIGMEEINDYIDDLELEYENLKKNSILDEYLDSL